MPSRRSFLTGLLATGIAPHASWADVGSPAYMAAAQLPSGAFALLGLSAPGAAVFQIPLPDRGHAAAAHPNRPLAVAFARRPGRFALVIDCLTGKVEQQLHAPDGYHFYGHGTFSGDGTTLFTTENDYDNARGMIGLWDVRQGFRRIGAIPSGGIGPHDIRLMPDGQTLVVANGGIETHPETGRLKLNLPEMRPNLSYLSPDGQVQEQVEPPRNNHMASIRHLAVRADGLIAAACQWQGAEVGIPPLLMTHQAGQAPQFHDFGQDTLRHMQGYLGSVAISGDEIAVTGPRGGLAVVTDTSGRIKRTWQQTDICGVARAPYGFTFTTGLGRVLADTGQLALSRAHELAWDNHLIAIG